MEMHSRAAYLYTPFTFPFISVMLDTQRTSFFTKELEHIDKRREKVLRISEATPDSHSPPPCTDPESVPPPLEAHLFRWRDPFRGTFFRGSLLALGAECHKASFLSDSDTNALFPLLSGRF